jgi:hypothetical protein
MKTIIRGRFGIGYRLSPYLFDNLGEKYVVANDSIFEGVNEKPKYVSGCTKEEIGTKKIL